MTFNPDSVGNGYVEITVYASDDAILATERAEFSRRLCCSYTHIDIH